MLSKIIYFCPSLEKPSGGVAVLLKHAMLLREAGFDSSVVYYPRIIGKNSEGRQRVELLQTDWLDFRVNGLPLVPLGRGAINLPSGERLELLPRIPLDEATLFVIPEGFAPLMCETQSSACRRLIFAQNWMFVLKTLPGGVSWRDYGIRHVLTVGENIKQFIDACMPGLEVAVVKFSINRSVFSPGPEKQALITFQVRNEYMLEKVEVIAKIFYLRNPHLRHYRFERLEGLSRNAFAARLAASRFVLYCDEIAGMPTLPLEAMACHAIPVGWKTHGGVEYMHENNGFWVENGDITGLAETLAKAVNQYERGTLNMALLMSGFERTLDDFTEEKERRNTLAYFERILTE